MLLSNQKQPRLYLTADLEARERRAGSGFAAHKHRFPPIDDVIAALDNIASRTIDLPRVFHSTAAAA